MDSEQNVYLVLCAKKSRLIVIADVVKIVYKKSY